MVESKVQKLLDRQQETLVKAAHSQAERAIGDTAVELHMQGSEITKAALIAALLAHAHAQQTKSLVLTRKRFVNGVVHVNLPRAIDFSRSQDIARQ